LRFAFGKTCYPRFSSTIIGLGKGCAEGAGRRINLWIQFIASFNFFRFFRFFRFFPNFPNSHVIFETPIHISQIAEKTEKGEKKEIQERKDNI